VTVAEGEALERSPLNAGAELWNPRLHPPHPVVVVVVVGMGKREGRNRR
jgi:hypothetical protein